MTSTSKRLEQTQRRLAKIEALQQTLEQMDRELTAYRASLARKLELLQKSQEPSRGPVTAPARPAPATQVQAGPGAERRSAPRRKGNPVPVLLTNANATLDPFQGWVLDRSTGGLRILVDQQVVIGTVLSVRPAKAHASFPWIQVKVRSCQPERSSFHLGVQFVQKPAWGEMQAFG